MMVCLTSPRTSIRFTQLHPDDIPPLATVFLSKTAHLKRLKSLVSIATVAGLLLSSESSSESVTIGLPRFTRMRNCLDDGS